MSKLYKLSFANIFKPTLLSALGVCMALSLFATEDNAMQSDYFQKKSDSFFLETYSKIVTNLEESLVALNGPNEQGFTQSLLAVAPCPGGAGVIGGKAFGDFNYNGIDDQIGDIPNVTVNAYSCDANGAQTLAGTAVTDFDGTYFISGLTDGVRYRLEFDIPAYLDYDSSVRGANNGTDVQFVTSPSCDANIGFSHPDDFALDDPIIFAACFINGDPLIDDSSVPVNDRPGNMDVLVAFPWSSAGDNGNANIYQADASEMGAIYGMANNRYTNEIYTSAFIKRHAGMGSLGLGGIYKTSYTGAAYPGSTAFVDVEAIGIDVGAIGSNVARGLPTDVTAPSNDPAAYDKVATEGIGEITLDEVSNELYFVNLFDQKVYSIAIDSDDNPATAPTAADVTDYSFDNPSCANGVFRPFAIEYYRGDIYAGGVCDGSSGGTVDDLTGKIFKLNTMSGVLEEIFSFPLDYVKGHASDAGSCEDMDEWLPWNNTIPAYCNGGPNSGIVVNPQPVLSDIEFDIDGSIVVGIMDRFGHQIGNANYGKTGTNTYSAITGGDILRIHNNQGAYVLESNGTAGAYTTAGATNGEGPNGGEFYFMDYFLSPFGTEPHQETSQGGIALYPGSGEIATSAFDPVGTNFFRGGFNWFNNRTGEARDPGYVVFSSTTTLGGTFGKAAGIGGSSIMRSATAPLEIGGYLWTDTNEDGIQDACEGPLSSVNVSLYAADGMILAMTQTTASGTYVFNEDLDDLEIQRNTTYYVVVGEAGQFDTNSGALNTNLFLTAANVGFGTNNDKNDSDGVITAGGIANNEFTGLPSHEITTGGFGFVDHYTDFGFSVQVVAGIGGSIFQDNNDDGINGAGDGTIGGVTLQLVDGTGTVIQTVTSMPDGSYFFPNVDAGDYTIVIDESTNTAGIDVFELAMANQGGDDTIDSDASGDPATITIIGFDPANGDSGNNDAGFLIPGANISGSLFVDTDMNGINDGAAATYEGVTVNLVSDGGTIVSTVIIGTDGQYVFTNVDAGDYTIMFDLSTNNDDYTTLTFSNADQGGDDTIDSDVNSTGDFSFSFDPADGGLTNVDAGVFLPTGNITGMIFIDADADGINDLEDTGVESVVVSLVDAFGVVVATFTTGPDGNYDFTGIIEGDYSIQVNIDNVVGNFDFTLTNQGNDDNIDSDVDNNGVLPFSFDPTGDPLVIDAGIFEVFGSIGNFVWGDTNENGIQDLNEDGVEDVTVTLYDATNDQLVATTMTAPSGLYSFNGIVAGEYYVVFDPSTSGMNNITFTTPNQGDGTNDSDAGIADGTTADFSFDPALGNFLDIDAGLVVPFAMIGNMVWLDCNQNGLNDNGESGYANVTVFLNGTDENGATVEQNTVTDANGVYNFNQVPAGNYQIVFALPNSPAGLAWTTQDAENDDAIDSDANAIGNTGFFDIVAGQMMNTIDAGLIDAQAPIFTNAPSDINTNCNDPILDDNDADVTDVTVTDNLATNVTVTFNEVTVNTGDCNGGIVITRTWIASDNCGNTATHVQTITAADEFAPVISSVPPDVTLECGTYPTDTIKAVDDCDMDLDIMISDTIYGMCPSTLERTFFATDDCGNTTMHTQVVTWEDTTAPTVTFTNPLLAGMSNGDTVMIECDQEFVFGPDDAMGVDICDSDLDMTFQDYINVEGDCADDGFIRLMYCGWTATDDCGNEGSIAIYIMVVDTTPPVIDINLPGDITVLCEMIPPVPPMPTATDNCTEIVEVEYVELMTGDTCADYKILRAWIAEDECGNQTIEQYNIFVETPELMFTNPPADFTVACEEGIPAPMDLDFTPLCNNPIQEFNEVIVGDTCSDYKINRVWTVTNDCGQSIQHLQSIFVTVEDLGLEGVPADASVDCSAVPAPATPMPTSDCYEVMIDFNEVILGDTCSDYQIVRTWIATDDCGNMVTEDQTIDVAVEELALTGVPADLTIDCTQPIPTPANPAATSDCYEVNIEFNEQQNGDICSDYTIVRTWTATDACGNTVMESQTITIEVPELGLVGVPADITIDCDVVVPTPVMPMATTGCFDSDIEFMQDMVMGDCPQELIITRTWVITDECNNQVSESQVITIEDNTAPTITFTNPMLNGLMSGDSITIGCDEIVNLGPEDAIYDDNCDDNFTTDFMEMTDIGDCDVDGYIIRMECCWKAADACGNMAEFCVIIRITDDEAPVLSAMPADITVDVPNGETIPDAPVITATDDCDGAPTVEFMETEQANPSGCGTMIMRTWIAEDHCGNQTIHTQTINVLELCDCPDIIVMDSQITNASCMASDGSIEVTMEFSPSIYDFVLVPNLGTQSAEGNAFTGLPVGSYLLVIDLPNVDDCEEKIFFDIVDDGCDDTIDVTITEPTEVCLADFGVIQTAGTSTSISFCNPGSAADVLAVANNTDCVNLTPAAGYEGTIATPICVTQCFDGSTVNCETTYINVTVEIPVIPCTLAIADATVVDEACANSAGSIDLVFEGAMGNVTYDWSNGMTTAAISGLSAGTYSIVATDEAGCEASGTFTINNQSSTSITFADISMSNVTCAGANDGVINSNTSSAYQVLNENGTMMGMTPVTGLSAGEYTVRDAAATCPSEIMVTITEPAADDVSVATSAVTCAGNDGSITVSIANANVQDYAFAWSNGNSTTNILADLVLGAGPYAVTVTNPQGCATILTGLDVMDGCNCTLAIDDVIVTPENCDQADGSIDISVAGNMGNLTYQWSPNVSTTSSATGLATGAYGVTVTDQTTLCITAATINVTEQTFNYSLTLSGETCPDANDGIASVTPTNLQYAWSHDANETAASLNNLADGIYTVQITDPVSGCTATEQFIIEGVDDWQFASSISNETCATNDGSINLTIDGGHGDYTYLWEDNVGSGAMATSLVAGTYQVTIVDVEGCSFELNNLVVGNDCAPCDDFIDLESAMVALNDCDGTAEFCVDIPFVEISGYTLTDNGQPFTGLVQPCNFTPSLSYSVLSLPNEGQTGPYVVTSWIVNGELFSGIFNDVPALVDSLSNWDTTADWALDANGATIFGGNAMSNYSAIEVTQTSNGATAVVMLDTNQVPMGAGFSVTAGTHELIFTETSTGCTDTVSVEAMCIESSTFEVTIAVGESGEYCLDTSELPGSLGDPELNCTNCFNANVSIDGNNCVQYTGLAEGTADAFIVICDDNSLCDTTFIIINVIPGFTTPPVAEMDVDSLDMNTSKSIAVLNNDKVNGVLAAIGFAAEASNGYATINEDFSVKYTPDTDYCGYDAFSYYICNEIDCDTTTVNIKVHCEGPIVITGFSPNNDGINDAFTILNLEQFPNHTLSVFNRWGEEVQSFRDYKNDWKGTYRSADLPDGTYFYVLTYGNGDSLTGYIQIQR